MIESSACVFIDFVDHPLLFSLLDFKGLFYSSERLFIDDYGSLHRGGTSAKLLPVHAQRENFRMLEFLRNAGLESPVYSLD